MLLMSLDDWREFTTPSLLTKWLQEAQGEGQWEDFAADYVMEKLSSI